MLKFVGKRLLQAVPILIGISLIAFTLIQLTPGGPAAAFRGLANVSAEDLARIKAEFGFDRPLIIQYFTWLIRFVQGDWGISFVARQPVFGLIMERLPATLLLMFSGITVSLIISIPLGLLAAIKRDTWIDHALTFTSFIGLSIPIFWLGLMLIIVFSVWLGWFPTGGMGPPGEEVGIGTRLWYLTLPTVAISMVSLSFFTRYLRASMIETMDQDYMRFNKARGVPPIRRYMRHAFRNAGIPFVTVVAIHIPEFLVGALVVETIFSWPGTGRLFWDSALRFDYPVLMGVLVLGSLMVLASNLLADVMYGKLDPRVRLD
ncbi:Dipeptide transport system permease protein DppB (TC 3.A.1.5.2) [hydrothermal vent metagenome]|uniref:Dipeptide transport system permease protein DppB (TC 3.A.1.5.2) n=1 Tax=hydrothermal vent metagenome TaxID=652676 RepID=A0A3B0SI91_9ZZZZ